MTKHFRYSISCLCISLAPFFCRAQTNPADSLDLKIGQMIMVGINDRTELAPDDPLVLELSNNKLGGVVLFEKNISKTDSRQKLSGLIRDLKKYSPVPLLVSIDEEGGKVHRLKPKYGFVGMPSASYLGKIDNRDSTLFYNRALASELASLGINFNYAPSLDLAINPENTVIVKRERSFSAKPALVTKHALLCIQAHHENGVKTILKHFPGHGSSAGDSHQGIVDVTSTWDFKELFPYYDVLKSGNCDAIMTAHLVNRNWDSTYLPATLSPNVINGMLRGLLGFKGVVFSDDMQMKAISSVYGVDKSIEMAVNAGVDIIMFGNNVDPKDKPMSPTEIHDILKKLVVDGKISPARINESYTRIMKMKTRKF